MTRADLAAAAAAAALLLALTPPTPAAAWQRVATVAELCAEAGARPLVRATLVRGQGRDGPIEYVELEHCTIVVAHGAMLRPGGHLDGNPGFGRA